MVPIELPPLFRCAFLLDLDGTLLDIAPAPDQVVVPPGLPDDLRRLRTLCGDALAIVTGRPHRPDRSAASRHPVRRRR